MFPLSLYTFLPLTLDSDLSTVRTQYLLEDAGLFPRTRIRGTFLNSYQYSSGVNLRFLSSGWRYPSCLNYSVLTSTLLVDSTKTSSWRTFIVDRTSGYGNLLLKGDFINVRVVLVSDYLVCYCPKNSLEITAFHFPRPTSLWMYLKGSTFSVGDSFLSLYEIERLSPRSELTTSGEVPKEQKRRRKTSVWGTFST